MGYNNNHAGIHLIRHNGYGGYTGMAYDQSVEDEYYYKALLEKHAQIEAKQKQRQEALTEQKQSEAPIHNIEQPAATIVPAKQAENNKKNMSKNKSPNVHNQQNEVDNPKQSIEAFLEITHREFGTEEVIDNSHFIDRDFITKNIIIRALKEKKDPISIIADAEALLFKDIRTNRPMKSLDGPYRFGVPKLESVMVFLSIVAEQLSCSVQELFIHDDAYYKKFAYELIDSIADSISYGEGATNQYGSAGIDIYLDKKHWLSEFTEGRFLRRINRHLYHIVISVGKDVYEDGTINYWLSYGDTSIYLDGFMDFVSKGTYLLDEEKGKLQEFVDKLIAEHPEWMEEE